MHCCKCCCVCPRLPCSSSMTPGNVSSELVVWLAWCGALGKHSARGRQQHPLSLRRFLRVRGCFVLATADSTILMSSARASWTLCATTRSPLVGALSGAELLLLVGALPTWTVCSGFCSSSVAVALLVALLLRQSLRRIVAWLCTCLCLRKASLDACGRPRNCITHLRRLLRWNCPVAFVAVSQCIACNRTSRRSLTACYCMSGGDATEQRRVLATPCSQRWC